MWISNVFTQGMKCNIFENWLITTNMTSKSLKVLGSHWKKSMLMSSQGAYDTGKGV